MWLLTRASRWLTCPTYASEAPSCVHLRRVVPRYGLTTGGYHQGYSRVFDRPKGFLA